MTEEIAPPVESLATKSPQKTHFSWLGAARAKAAELGIFAGSAATLALGTAEKVQAITAKVQIETLEKTLDLLESIAKTPGIEIMPGSTSAPELIEKISELSRNVNTHDAFGNLLLAGATALFIGGATISVGSTIIRGLDLKKLERELHETTT